LEDRVEQDKLLRESLLTEPYSSVKDKKLRKLIFKLEKKYEEAEGCPLVQERIMKKARKVLQELGEV
jgi:hypothetical protein